MGDIKGRSKSKSHPYQIKKAHYMPFIVSIILTVTDKDDRKNVYALEQSSKMLKYLKEYSKKGHCNENSSCINDSDEYHQ